MRIPSLRDRRQNRLSICGSKCLWGEEIAGDVRGGYISINRGKYIIRGGYISIIRGGYMIRGEYIIKGGYLLLEVDIYLLSAQDQIDPGHIEMDIFRFG